MLRLMRLEVDGFGPFADRQVIDFPTSPGVVVIYGENMRGKTTLLNAIRYAFFGEVLGRGSFKRQLHSISNRELAADGKYGFGVTLTFSFGGEIYELHRSCEPVVVEPASDSDYRQEPLLKRGSAVLGPQERDRALARIFPKDISRFFLFDGELLQEYEELIISESVVGPQISSAIERILGVPILKAARRHLTELADEADKQAAAEASRHKATEGWGISLNHALQKREEHQRELARLSEVQRTFSKLKGEIEAKLSADRKYASLLDQRDKAQSAINEAVKGQVETRAALKRVMVEAWRSVLREPVRVARDAAQAALQARVEALEQELRAAAVDRGHCSVCDQDISRDLRQRLAATLRPTSTTAEGMKGVPRLRELASFDDADRSGEVRHLVRRLQELAVEEKAKGDEVHDLDSALKDADPATVRSTQATYTEVIENLTIVKSGIAGETEKLATLETSIERLRDKIRIARTQDLTAIEARTRLVRGAATVFREAIDSYKADLRQRVEASATELFLAMSTERTDYARLSINSDYGLTILHKDGRPEEARSAGAEHVVALALMGALQRNAPLRGPIVMDSPFGRLDEGHTSNVVGALHKMAEQVVLLIYESEVGRGRARSLLGPRLIAEYELERISSRRTNIRKVQ